MAQRQAGRVARRSRVAAAIGVALSIAASSASAHSYKFGDIAVGHLWAPPTTGGETDVFGPIFNSGQAGDALLSASSDEAKQVVFRTGTREAAATGAIDLPVGKPVSLASWGVHLRLVGLAHPLKQGDWVPIVLVFRNAGQHQVKALVEKSPSE